MEPSLVEPGGGEQVSDTDRRAVSILLAHELLTVTESRYAEGQAGPDLHVHREHSDCFWVLSGELEFELAEGEVVRAGAGGFVLVPPGVVHTFRNDGPGEARFLNLHAPDAGFAAYMRGHSDGFDSYDPPADGGRPASEAILLEPGDGEPLAAGATTISFKAQSHDGIGSVAVTETTLAPGFPGPVAHRHARMLDSFYVLEGTLTLQLGDERVEAPAGSFAAAPPGHVHTFSNPGDAPVRLLNAMAPAGLEQYLKEVAAALRPGEPPDPARMAAIAAAYDFEPA